MRNVSPGQVVEAPFGTERVEEVALSNAPLVLVVAQVRFPEVASIRQPEFIGPFQEAIRSRYPAGRPEREVQALFGPEGVQSHSETVWRFRDKLDQWQVSLGPSFLALDTKAYANHADFVARLEEVLRALEQHVRPSLFDRLGLRYVDRVALEEPGGREQLSSLVRPEVAGVVAMGLGKGARLQHSICDSGFQLDDGATLHARWGLLPAGATFEPLRAEALEAPSWVLDLDMFQLGPSDFDVAAMSGITSGFADRIYRVFRWIVTPDFLRRFGGDV
jgi:uncharacterized protein (TIGR04255 family)